MQKGLNLIQIRGAVHSATGEEVSFSAIAAFVNKYRFLQKGILKLGRKLETV